MKNILVLIALIPFCYKPVMAQNTAPEHGMDSVAHVTVNKADLTWGEAPPALPKGAMVAVLNGDPSKEGMFTMRVMFPENYRIAPHWHPSTENVTVLEGNFYMGTGEKFNEQTAKMLEPEGYSVMPAKMPHYAFTKDKCTIQVHAMGPFAVTYINPADDPRKK
jgi:quercetin dioxygenase-like cupin family protein